MGIHVCSPSGGSASSPVSFSASANSYGQLREIALWLDGKKVAEQYHVWGQRAYFNFSDTLAAGSHRVVFFAADEDNRLQENVSYINVGSGGACSAPSSAGVSICTPASGSTVSSPVQVQAAATVTGTIAETELWVDGVEKYSVASNTLTASVSLGAGSHRFAVLALNTAGEKWETAVDATVAGGACSAPSSPGVHVCAPANGSTVGSPVQVEATSTVTGTIASTQLWVDGVKKDSVASNTLTTSVSLGAGTHRFAVLSVNTAGQKWETAVDATVN